jgi:pectinesterase
MPAFSPYRRRLLATGALSPVLASWPAAARADSANAYQVQPDIVVATDGSGQFTSIQAALQSIPVDNRERVVVLIRNGLYDEAVRVDAPYVTLRGESRMGARLRMDRPASLPKNDIGQGVLNIAATAHDFVLENITVHNTVKAIGPHAFAVLGRADRTIVQDADILSLGSDTLSLWADGGRYYHTGLRVMGSVDFVCPRGWCYMADSDIVQVNPRAEAAVWHDGAKNEDKKFVMVNCRFDGPQDFILARHHHDAQFYFVDCHFSERMRDRAPHMVIYPLDGGTPTQADIDRNKAAAADYHWGERSYFYHSHRASGDYAWHADNLATAPGHPAPSTIDAAWTFAGAWNPERADGPQVTQVAMQGAAVTLAFDRPVTVKGAPRLVASGGTGRYRGGSGTTTLVLDAAGGAPQRLDLTEGAIIGSEAVARIVPAQTTLPRPG